jgi:Ni/Fe-hydrogenase subunit HybB-like protein
MTDIDARRGTVKTILWAIMGILAVVTFARFRSGLGATTGLSDVTPWGFWIAFDVMAGVALAAGGFTLAATVYIFRIERYRSFIRPAILTAMLGYAAVATGLLYDLGLPWRIWHPIIYPQFHSVLFEVAMCVMLYLGVLCLEFTPVILEHPIFDRPFFRAIQKLLKQATIVLVIAGIVLSTLHQSSLGSLFLIAPHRVHPLWYSPIIWILFFISAVGLGLMMVALESLVSGWLFGHKVRMDLLGGLGKVASPVLFLYGGLRVADLAWRGQLGEAFDGSFLGGLFLFELALTVAIPAVLLAIPRVRATRRGIATAAVLTVFGARTSCPTSRRWWSWA